MKWFIGALELRNRGILGMNCRNIDFIGRYNERRLYPLVDDKLKTKRLAQRHGLPVPRLRFVVREQHMIRDVARRRGQRTSLAFVARDLARRTGRCRTCP